MSDEQNLIEEEGQDLPEQIAIRLAKRDKLNELSDAYPVSLPITHTIGQVRAAYPDLEIDTATGETVALAGRVMFQRNTGSSALQPYRPARVSASRPCSRSTRWARSSSSSTRSW